MDEKLGLKAGTALIWQGIQHSGVKAIYLIRIPILARLLSPDDFGLMAIAIASVGLLMQVTDFGMVPALVQRSDVDDQHYDAAWTVGVLRALGVTTAVFFTAPWIAALFSEPRAAAVIQVLAMRPALQALASIRVADLTRDLRFRGIATLNLTEALANAIISIALAPILGVWALVAGSLVGPVCYTVLSYVLAPSRPRLTLQRAATTTLLRYGRWIFLTGIVGMAGTAALNAVISRRLGTAELGLYFLAARIAFLPTEVAGDVVGNVAFPLYSRIQSEGQRARAVFRSLLVAMSAVLLPSVALLIALAPSLVEEVLGPRWDGTAPVVRFISVAVALGLFSNAAAPVFKGVGQPSRITMLRAAQSLVLVALAWDFSGRLGVAGAAAAWIPASALGTAVGAVMLVRLFPGILMGLGVPMLVLVAVSSAGGLVAFSLDQMIDGLAGLLVGGVVGAGVLGVALWRLDARFSLGLRSLVAGVAPAASDALGRRKRGSPRE